MPAFISNLLTSKSTCYVQKSLTAGRMTTRDLRVGQVSVFPQSKTLLEHLYDIQRPGCIV